MRLHDLDPNQLAALRQAYAHQQGEIAALKGDKEAWSTLEVLARKGLLHFHRVQHAASYKATAYVYRITKEGRLELHPEPVVA